MLRNADGVIECTRKRFTFMIDFKEMGNGGCACYAPTFLCDKKAGFLLTAWVVAAF